MVGGKPGALQREGCGGESSAFMFGFLYLGPEMLQEAPEPLGIV